MALIIPVGFAQCLLPMAHASLNRSALITYGLDVDAAGGDYVQVADDQQAIFGNAWGNELDSQVTIGPATLRVGQDGGDPLSVEGSATSVGVETGAMASPNCALLVKKASLTGGRRGRGRCYIPWVLLDAAISDVGVVDSGSLAVRQSDAEDWLEDLELGTTGTYATPMVILHDSSGSGAEPAPSVVTGLLCDSLIANQRRRLGR